MAALSLEFSNEPNAKTLEEAITALRSNNDDIGTLYIQFNDENFPTSRELQNIILEEVASKNIKTLRISNWCRQPDLRHQCYEFALQCIAVPHNTGILTDLFVYGANFPFTLDDAKRMAIAISNSNGHITTLGFTYSMFSKDDTLECIFNAVLEKRVPGFWISAMWISANRSKLIGRICTANKSKRTTNNTLQKLYIRFESNNNDAIVIDDDEIIQLSNILQTYTGLNTLLIDGKKNIMSITGRQLVLEAMRDSTALTKLVLPKCYSWLNLQSQIDDQITKSAVLFVTVVVSTIVWRRRVLLARLLRLQPSAAITPTSVPPTIRTKREKLLTTPPRSPPPPTVLLEKKGRKRLTITR